MQSTLSRPVVRPVINKPCVRRTISPLHAIKLYSHPRSRGRLVEWYIKELDVDAEIVNLDMAAKEHKDAKYLALNPFGKVPAMEDGDLKLAESGAILLYLAEKYGGLTTPEQRARANQWILFANSTLTQAIFIEAMRDKQFAPIFETLDKILGQHDFIDGPEFSVADISIAQTIAYIPMFLPQLDLSPYPNVNAYVKRCRDRPAAQATVAAPV